ncbi:hypothetical protein [Demequina mangrovi]|uniref:Uncharacterized protein n=1 Tax=Demequina mangrovi TaxID=1043493 RepID=A0A1H6Z0R3_9MICO|nr:hypothetical protein [Demequina mangrovi]SEJ46256.1 hypothetical protein SAMN05421637_1866 [Demequina mangrovi]
MTLGEHSRQEADARGTDVPARASDTVATHCSPFPPVTEPAAHDRVDTDEIPVVGEAQVIDAAHRYGEDDAADPLIEPEAEPDVEAARAAEPRIVVHRSRPVGLIVAVALMSVTLLAAITLSAYLWRVTEAWEAQVAEITDQAYALGAQVAAARESLTETEEQLDLVEQQLSASKDTVLRLQSENAQWGDDAAFAQEEIAALENVITDATSVAGSLSRCIEGHEQLEEYLRTPDDYDPDELESFATSVEALCDAAADSNVAFQQSVAP